MITGLDITSVTANKKDAYIVDAIIEVTDRKLTASILDIRSQIHKTTSSGEYLEPVDLSHAVVKKRLDVLSKLGVVIKHSEHKKVNWSINPDYSNTNINTVGIVKLNNSIPINIEPLKTNEPLNITINNNETNNDVNPTLSIQGQNKPIVTKLSVVKLSEQYEIPVNNSEFISKGTLVGFPYFLRYKGFYNQEIRFVKTEVIQLPHRLVDNEQLKQLKQYLIDKSKKHTINKVIILLVQPL